MKLGKYQHSKTGKYYRVIGVVRHSETLEEVEIDGKMVPQFKFTEE